MKFAIVTNMGHQKKPWSDVHVEVLIEYERQKREHLEDKREQLRAPMPQPPESVEPEVTEETEHVIIIKL